jgi:hypothetical protein
VIGLTGGHGLTELLRLRPHYCRERRNLRVFRGRMLLLCKPVRDSERKRTPITGENQGKGKKQGGILEYRMEELGPMGIPPGGPTFCAPYAITLRALCDKPPHQVHSQPDVIVKLQLGRQYKKLPLDDSPEMVIRNYEE